MIPELKPIGFVRSCFKEKFGIPRQAGLAKHARGYVEIDTSVVPAESIKGLEFFTHLWIIFYFHGHAGGPKASWSPTVRPPRLGGNRRVGVFASRSPYRPNGLGMSIVKFEGVERVRGAIRVKISGLDLLDGTPVFDIKPYMPVSDSIPRASNGWTKKVRESEIKRVIFSREAGAALKKIDGKTGELKKLIRELLLLDPRPRANSNQKYRKKDFAFRLYDYDVKWMIDGQIARVVGLEHCAR